jgi:outer membrane protein TolC
MMSFRHGQRFRERSLEATAVMLAVLVLASPAVGQEIDHPPLTFGSLLDPSASGDTERLLDLIQAEIVELLRRDTDLRFPDGKRRVSDWTAAGIRRELGALLADPEVDIVLVIGPVSTAALCCYDELPKPVFAPLGVDGEALGLPSKGDASGVKNLNYLSNPGASYRDLEMLTQLADFDVVYVLTDPGIYEVLEGLYERNQQALKPLGISSQPVPVVASAEEALEKLPPTTRAVYFTPLLRMSLPEKRKLIDGLNRRGVLTMSLLGREEVELGVLAGLRQPADFPRMARRIALNVQQALFGRDPGTFSITFERGDRLTLNMETARKIGFYPSWRLLADAIRINDEISTAITLTFSQAVLNALTANRRIAAAQRTVGAREQAVKEVRAGYLPRLEGSLDTSAINEERAIFRAERNVSAGATLSQVIWSDPLATSIRVQRDLLGGTRQQLVEIELDVAAEAASAFLEVLRSENLERIARENLRRVEANLDLASNRVRVGYASPAEVYRWEVERANGRNSVIFAGRVFDSARARMNQLMYRPQEESFTAEQPDVEGDPYLVVANEELAPFYDNPRSFRIFRAFMVEDGLTNSPELRRLDAAISARERQLGQARRAFWSPTIGLQGDFDRVLAQDADRSPTGFLFPENEWTVGLSVALPLYTGGERQATKSRTRQELDALQRDREELAQQIELRIRTSMFRIAASWNNIDLSREAALASQKNLDLVTDSYATGVVSIQDLLDAQNSTLTAKLRAANAIYDFLLDLVEVQRAVGRLEWFRAEENRDAWVQRIRDYFEAVRQSGQEPEGFE